MIAGTLSRVDGETGWAAGLRTAVSATDTPFSRGGGAGGLCMKLAPCTATNASTRARNVSARMFLKLLTPGLLDKVHEISLEFETTQRVSATSYHPILPNPKSFIDANSCCARS